MEILFLDENFNLLSAPVDRYYSLSWGSRYYDDGEFDIHLDAEYLPIALAAEYVYNNEEDEAMVIVGIKAENDGKRTFRITGRSLESVFRERVMDEAGSYNGTVEEIARSAVTKYAMTENRAIPLLELGDLSGYTDTAAATNKAGAELYEWLRELLKPYEMSFKLHYDYEQNKLLFTVYRGLDRTQEQDTNTWAVFSTSYENLSRFSYSMNRTDYRNYAIVVSRDGAKRVEVDATNGSRRRELYVDADDGLDTASMTQLGEQALSEYALVETVSGEVQPGANMIYGINYALGDLCHIEDASLGISSTARLTEMTTVVENGTTRRIPAFGEQYLTLRQYVAREVNARGGSGGGSSAPAVDLTEVWAAISANADAINANAADIEAAQAAIYDNAQAITALDGRVTTLEENAGGLPSGFAELSYIQSHGGQWIDTGFKPNNNTRIVMDAQIMSTVTQSGLYCFFGCRGGGYFYEMYKAASSHTDVIWFWGTLYSKQFTIDYTVRHLIDVNKNTAAIDNQTASYTNASFQMNYNVYLCADNNAGTAEGKTAVKIYMCKIYDNGTLVRDFIPAKNSAGVIGLFDKVNYQFYTNAGTGSLTGG